MKKEFGAAFWISVITSYLQVLMVIGSMLYGLCMNTWETAQGPMILAVMLEIVLVSPLLFILSVSMAINYLAIKKHVPITIRLIPLVVAIYVFLCLPVFLFVLFIVISIL